MLNPKIVIPVHYMLFEYSLFAAIHCLTNNALYKNEFDYRRLCLKKALYPQFKIVDNKQCFVMRRACKPHPYIIDTYASKILFYEKNDNFIASFQNNVKNDSDNDTKGFEIGEFIYGEVPINAAKFTYVISDVNTEIFSGKINDNETKNKPTAKVYENVVVKIANNARYSENGNVLISKEFDKFPDGRIVYELPNTEELNEDNYYGIEIENFTNEKFGTGIILLDSKKQAVSRYYMPLMRGKNLILFNILGFHDIEKLSDLKQIELRVYVSNSDKIAICKPGRLLRFSDMFELRNYRLCSGYSVFPQR